MFFPKHPHWRWISWEEAARQVVERAEQTNAGETDKASPWPAEPTPDAVLDTLATWKASGTAPDRKVSAAARRWSDVLADRGSSREPVELWVAGFLDRPRELQLLAWSILAGAGLILPGEDARRVATILWARPTVVSGDRTEISLLVQGLRERKVPAWMAWSRRLHGEPVLPLGRIHSVVATGSEMLAEEDRAWLETAGVRVLHDPHSAAP